MGDNVLEMTVGEFLEQFVKDQSSNREVFFYPGELSVQLPEGKVLRLKLSYKSIHAVNNLPEP